MLEFINIQTDEEVKILAALAKEIWEEYWPCLLTDGQIKYMVNKFQSQSAIRAQIDNEKYIYKILKNGEENLGYFAVAPKNKKCWGALEDEIEPYLFLSKLYVKGGKRGMGLGSKGFFEIKKIAENLNLKSIYLTVNKQNENSIKAYEKWGFKTVETAVTQIGEGFVMDDFIMKYEI